MAPQIIPPDKAEQPEPLQPYRSLRERTMPELMSEANKLTDKGYALHSWRADGPNHYVAVMELPPVDYKVKG